MRGIFSGTDRVNPLEGELAGLREKLDRAIMERDAYFQEVFESDRYTALLSAERQSLVDRINADPRRFRIAELEESLSSLQAYCARIEAAFYKLETERVALAGELADALSALAAKNNPLKSEAPSGRPALASGAAEKGGKSRAAIADGAARSSNPSGDVARAEGRARSISPSTDLAESTASTAPESAAQGVTGQSIESESRPQATNRKLAATVHKSNRTGSR